MLISSTVSKHSLGVLAFWTSQILDFLTWTIIEVEEASLIYNTHEIESITFEEQ